MPFTRREFLETSLRAGLSLPAAGALPSWVALLGPGPGLRRGRGPGSGVPWGDAARGMLAPERRPTHASPRSPIPHRDSLSDLSRHFVSSTTILRNAVPALQQTGASRPSRGLGTHAHAGPYDSRSAAVIEHTPAGRRGRGAREPELVGKGSFTDGGAWSWT